MRKKMMLMIALLVMCMLIGCQQDDDTYKAAGSDSTVTEHEKVKMSEVDSFEVDMSGYSGMDATDHQYVGVSPQELINIVDNAESGLFYIGYEKCPACNVAVPLLNEAAKEMDLKVYYVDAYNDTYPLKDSYDVVVMKVNDGPAIYTPHVIAIVDGVLVKDELGLIEGFDEKNEVMVRKQVEVYKDMMKFFKIDDIN